MPSSPFARAEPYWSCASGPPCSEPLRGILWHAGAIQIPDTEFELRFSILLLGGTAEPAHALGIVLFDTLAAGIQSREHHLRRQIAGVPRLSCPEQGRNGVFRNAAAREQDLRKRCLRRRIAGLGKPPQRRRIAGQKRATRLLHSRGGRGDEQAKDKKLSQESHTRSYHKKRLSPATWRRETIKPGENP